MENNNLTRMSIWDSIVFAGAPALLAYIAMWFVAPAIQTWTGQPFLVGYLVAWGCMEALIFSASLLAFRIEGNEFNWNNIKERYRINRPKRADLVWVAVTLVVMLGTYLALGFTARWLGNFSYFAPHPSFPPELMPGAEQDVTPGVFMGMQLKGKWWVLVLERKCGFADSCYPGKNLVMASLLG
jgi:hypothetical protein